MGVCRFLMVTIPSSMLLRDYYVVAIEDNNANLEYDPNIDKSRFIWF